MATFLIHFICTHLELQLMIIFIFIHVFLDWMICLWSRNCQSLQPKDLKFYCHTRVNKPQSFTVKKQSEDFDNSLVNHCSSTYTLYSFFTVSDWFIFPLLSIAISGALCQHPARPHPNQGQLCGAGGHRGHQGHLPEVPQQVGPHVGLSEVVCTLFANTGCSYWDISDVWRCMFDLMLCFVVKALVSTHTNTDSVSVPHHWPPDYSLLLFKWAEWKLIKQTKTVFMLAFILKRHPQKLLDKKSVSCFAESVFVVDCT